MRNITGKGKIRQRAPLRWLVESADICDACVASLWSAALCQQFHVSKFSWFFACNF